MKVSKNKVTLLSLAVAALFATAAQAALNLDTGATPATYAKEITGTLSVPNTGNVFDVTAKMGFGVVATQDRFFRFDLTGGTFGATVTGAMLTTVLPANVFGPVTAVNGGQVGDNYVIFQVNGGTGGQLATDSFLFAMPALKFATTAAAVNVQYRMFQDLASASGGVSGVPIINDGRLLVNKSGALVNFVSAINTTFQGARTEYIAATTNFTFFCDGGLGAPGTAGCAATTDALAIAGTIATYGLTAGVILDATSTPLVNINQVLAAGTATKLTTSAGAFQITAGAAAGYTANTLNCLALGTGGTITPVTGAAITYATSNVALTAPTSLCYKVDGTSSVVDQDISGSFQYVYQAGYAGPASSTPGLVGLFRRDGVELQSPWFTTTNGYISRFFLTNTGSINISCNVLTWNGAGAVTPSTPVVTVNAGTQLKVDAVSVLPAMPSGPYATRFVCAAPSASMQGNYVLTSPSGSVTIGGMIRPGTN